MRMSIFFTVAAIGASGLAACDRSAPNAPSAATPAEKAATPDAHPSATLLSNVTAAPDFVAKAAAGDRFEIDSSKLALSRSTNKDVTAFASEMIAAHTETSAAIKRAIGAAGVDITPSSALPGDLQAKLDDLAKVGAADFDKTYMAMQVDGHQAALDLMQRYAQDGDVAQLKQFAADAAPTVQHHLTMAKDIKALLK